MASTTTANQFHINIRGEIAPCTAEERQCPRGGEHYSSKEEAATALMERDTQPPPQVVAVGKYRGRPEAELLADRGYCYWLLQQKWFKKDHPDLYKRVQRSMNVQRLRSDFNKL